MSYRVLPEAQQDLMEIDDWVIEHFGLEFADRTVARLNETFDLLTEFPYMGHTRPDIDPRGVLFFHHHPYWIVYEPSHPLRIHRVIHGARNLKKI